MSHKNKKQFGVWMDSHHATVVGKEKIETGDFVILDHLKYEESDHNSGEKNAHNAEKSLQLKFFNHITTLMQNAEEVHLTGTGIAQEQFKHFLASTPQFKNTVSTDSTSNKMSDEKLLEFIKNKFQ